MTRIGVCESSSGLEEVDLTRIRFLVRLGLELVLVFRRALVVEAPRYANVRAARCRRRVARATTTRQLPIVGSNSFFAEAPGAWAGNAACRGSLPVVESLDRADQSCPTGNRRS